MLLIGFIIDICEHYLSVSIGMHAGLPKYVPVNLRDIESAGFADGEEVSLESLKERGIINPSGRERTLPLKVRTCTVSKLNDEFCSLAIDLVGTIFILHVGM